MNQNHNFHVEISPRYKNIEIKNWVVENNLIDKNKINFCLGANPTGFYSIEKEQAIKLAKSILQYYQEK